MSLRLMDEFFRIEKKVGKIYGIIGLQFESDKEYVDERDIVYHEFPEPEQPAEPVAKPEGEGDEEGDQEPPPAEEGEDGEQKEPAFKPEDYRWTVTERKPANLPTLFLQVKGKTAYHDIKSAEAYSSSSQYEAVCKCLDDFCSRLVEPVEEERYLYTQVLFAK